MTVNVAAQEVTSLFLGLRQALVGGPGPLL